MYMKNFFFAVLSFLLLFSSGKINGQESYNHLRKQYEDLNEKDESALPFINYYIKKAKQEKNYSQLVQGYRDRAYYSKDKALKIKYADSAVITARKTKDDHLIADTHSLKGSLYYFYYKNYPAALDEYLKAFEYSKKGNDEYLTHKIIYQMGLVKIYLGYYDEALEHFSECIAYFEPKTKENNHPNQIYNDNKGYLNSLHQSIVCYQNIRAYKKADSLTNAGLNFANVSKDFPLEQAYFIKSKGISDYYHKNYKGAEQNLSKVLPLLQKKDDVYWISVSKFYIGKSFWDRGNEEQAVQQFRKVDSIFKKRQFIFPELQENYELLISYFKNMNEPQQEYIYTQDLLEVSQILKKDYPNLSSKIHKGYDNRILSEAKDHLEYRSNWSFGVITVLVLVVTFFVFLIWKYEQNGKRIKQNYSELDKKLRSQTSESTVVAYEDISAKGKSVINKKTFSHLQIQLNNFESGGGFKEKGLTIDMLAETFGTNKSYLSHYINDVKGMNFSKYLSILRINYITKLMYENPDYLKLSIEGLADECGIGSRQSFSNLFYEINRIRPTDFIRQRKKELGIKE